MYAFVNSKRLHHSKGVSVMTHGSNSAHMYVVTLDPTAAQHVAMYLNQWKRAQKQVKLATKSVGTDDEDLGTEGEDVEELAVYLNRYPTSKITVSRKKQQQHDGKERARHKRNG
eukprot:TRINITY_DN3781_c1_g1_i1.p1 TRINITY_DN3781_c1_g1~~TRINITY_DN3781_c1_g1_i1.p1  ORF type:complete len:130 (-),score=18.34 TRINITY_DN3781_c1_g1_i1:257-598(-)